MTAGTSTPHISLVRSSGKRLFVSFLKYGRVWKNSWVVNAFWPTNNHVPKQIAAIYHCLHEDAMKPLAIDIIVVIFIRSQNRDVSPIMQLRQHTWESRICLRNLDWLAISHLPWESWWPSEISLLLLCILLECIGKQMTWKLQISCQLCGTSQ